MARPHIIHVARECSGVVSGGGVGDVVQQLALQCASEGYDTFIILPRYGQLDPGFRLSPLGPEMEFSVPMGYGALPHRLEQVRILEATLQVHGARVNICLVDAERFRGKQHPYVYTGQEAGAHAALKAKDRIFCGAERPPPGVEIPPGAGHFDFFAMNVLLQKAALRYACVKGLAPPMVFHAHDAHAAALPLLARVTAGLSPEGLRTVVTAHNLGTDYRQRCADREFVSAVLGVGEDLLGPCWLDGWFDPFAAAAFYADHLTTVSEGYAWEVEQGGQSADAGSYRGFSYFLRHHRRKLRGITNGISPREKGPEALDSAHPCAPLDPNVFSWKVPFKEEFLGRLSRLPSGWNITPGQVLGHLGVLKPDHCLFTFVGRLTHQKAPDILIRAVQEVLSFLKPAGLCLLGDSADPRIQDKLASLTQQFSGRVVVLQGFSPQLSAEIFAAGDFFLIPSRFEPCGLIDFIAQLNGNIPIVNQVGGLAKVVNNHTGIGYFALDDRTNLRGLVDGMLRARELFDDPARLDSMRQQAAQRVRSHHTWEKVFPAYRELYEG